MMTFQNRLTDITEDWNDSGYCHCNNCKDSPDSYQGECPEPISKCNRERPFDFYGNETVKAFCENVNCADCLSVIAKNKSSDLYTNKKNNLVPDLLTKRSVL